MNQAIGDVFGFFNRWYRYRRGVPCLGVSVPRRLTELAVIHRSAAAQYEGVGWHLGHQIAFLVEPNLVAFCNRTNAFRVQIPLVENAFYDRFIALFHHHEHALLGLAEEDFKRLHVRLAQRHFVQINVHAHSTGS